MKVVLSLEAGQLVGHPHKKKRFPPLPVCHCSLQQIVTAILYAANGIRMSSQDYEIWNPLHLCQPLCTFNKNQKIYKNISYQETTNQLTRQRSRGQVVKSFRFSPVSALSYSREGFSPRPVVLRSGWRLVSLGCLKGQHFSCQNKGGTTQKQSHNILQPCICSLIFLQTGCWLSCRAWNWKITRQRQRPFV